jgi:hypothetical protein
MPPNTVKVGRTTPYGNPFDVTLFGHDEAVRLHRACSRERQLTRKYFAAPD